MIRLAAAMLSISVALLGCAKKSIAEYPHKEDPPDWRPVLSNDPQPAGAFPPELPYSPPDNSRGAELFRKCAPCHSIQPDGRAGIGPKLFGVAGSVKASTEFRYSEALKTKGGIWDDASLDAFITRPRDFVPGNKMTFGGIADANDRAALILFLKSQK